MAPRSFRKTQQAVLIQTAFEILIPSQSLKGGHFEDSSTSHYATATCQKHSIQQDHPVIHIIILVRYVTQDSREYVASLPVWLSVMTLMFLSAEEKMLAVL